MAGRPYWYILYEFLWKWCLQLLQFFSPFLSLEAKQHMFLTTRKSWGGWYTKLATQTETLLKKEGWWEEGEEIVNIQPHLQPASFYYTREMPDPLRPISGTFNHFSDAFLFVPLNIFFSLPLRRVFLPVFRGILRHFFSICYVHWSIR